LKNIAYIEIDTHAEIAADFMDLMSNSHEFSVDYYFSERILKQIKKGEESVFLSDSFMILDQLENQKYDLIIIGTVHRYFNTFLKITQSFNTSVIVHNINFSTISKLDLFKNIFKADFTFRLKLLLKESLFSASKVYQSAKNLLVLDEEISSEKLKFLPLFYTRNFEKTVNDVFTIVIPGGVSQKRRDYKKVIREIQNLELNIQNEGVFKSNLIEFIFLGKAKGEELKQLHNLEKSLKQIKIKFYSERVSSEEFDFWMKKADVLWCPIQSEAEFFSQKEIYGKTKMTGNIGDAIKFGKPAVFTQNYTSKLCFIIPEQENISEQFQQLNDFEFDFQKDFNKDEICKKLEKTLHELI